MSVIYNKNGASIGQLIGNGITVNVDKASVCVPSDKTIEECADFGEFDFAGPYKTKNGSEPGTPLELKVTFNKKHELCSTFAKKGMYFPIKRMAGSMEELDKIKCEKNCFGSSARGTPLSDENTIDDYSLFIYSAVIAYLFA